MKHEGKLARAFYIVIVPLMLLMLLLNGGFLQRVFTAVTVDGERYTAVQYNYYYFRVYQEFVESEEYLSSGYNVNGSAGSQQYDESTTYKEHFAAQAYERMVLTARYDRMAQEAGYECSERELESATKLLAEITEFCQETGIKERNYYSAYYGSGMDRERFEAELLRETRAQAYRAHLAESMEWQETEIDLWLTEHPMEDYPLADLWLVELDAVPARTDGTVGQQELADLQARLTRLQARYESGDMTMEELVARYADTVWGEDGLVADAMRSDLPEAVADWCFEENEVLPALAAFLDSEKECAYLALLVKQHDSAARTQARVALSEQAVEDLDAELLEETAVSYHTVGMQLTTR